jgi:predicted transporter
MKKILSTLAFSLLVIEAATAHTDHKSISHIHMTESISFGITSILTITFIISIIFIKKQFKKNKNHAS